ncbi:MAG: hypothetical protein C4327_06750 [Meiothermus sp.]
MTLRTRITLLTLALLAFSLLLIGASVYGTLRGTLYNNLRNDLQDASQNAVRLIKDKASLADLPTTVYGKALLLLSVNPNPSVDDLMAAAIPLSSSPSLSGRTPRSCGARPGSSPTPSARPSTSCFVRAGSTPPRG